MKQLHEPEQRKRQRRLGQAQGKRGTKQAKAAAQDRKYRAGAIGVIPGGGAALSRAGAVRNDLFPTMKEAGVRCHASEDVDETLIRRANDWMERLPQRQTRGDAPEVRGVLVVLSKDSDFSELLSDASTRHVVAVSASNGRDQTRALVYAADVTLTGGEACACSPYGRRFLEDRGLTSIA